MPTPHDTEKRQTWSIVTRAQVPRQCGTRQNRAIVRVCDEVLTALGQRNLVENLPHGNGQFDPCVSAGNSAMQTNNAGGGHIGGVNGAWRCGATSCWTVGGASELV